MDKYKLKREQLEVEGQYHKDNRCQCANTKLRRRTLKNGSIQYVYQCLSCGKATSKAIKSSEAEKINGGSDFENFDNSIEDNWYKKYQEGLKKIKDKYGSLIDNAEELRKQKDDAFFRKYTEYLDSDKWHNKRRKVLTRANFICEGCLENEATQVHHLTYEHVFDELIFELVALCESCHDFIHKKNDEEK